MLSVEKVIDDITGPEPQPIAAEPAGLLPAVEERPAVEVPQPELTSPSAPAAAEPPPASQPAKEVGAPVIEARKREGDEERSLSRTPRLSRRADRRN